MKKILICLCLGTPIFAMDKNPYTRTLEIPGALKPSEGHSPSEQPRLNENMLELERSVQNSAGKIAQAATDTLLQIYSSGKIPGSLEISQQLRAQFKILKEQALASKKDKKLKISAHQTNQITASIDTCILHVATTINESIAFQSERHSSAEQFKHGEENMFELAKSVQNSASTITEAVINKLLEIYSTGKTPGSAVSQRLVAQYEILKKQDATNQKDRKLKESAHQTNQITATIDACILHFAATINDSIAFQKAKIDHP